MIEFHAFGSAPIWRKLDFPRTAQVSGFQQRADIKLEKLALGGLAFVVARKPGLPVEPALCVASQFDKNDFHRSFRNGHGPGQIGNLRFGQDAIELFKFAESTAEWGHATNVRHANAAMSGECAAQ